jgi:pimeloyl-ACP methyl ester carboxylesterase
MMPLPMPANAPAEPALRRAYFDCRHGQLHAYLAIPAGGGFDEKTAVVCVPGKPGSGAVFGPLLSPLGRDRSVYAIDLPGCGLSDAPRTGVSGEAQASGLLDLIRDLRLRRVNILAQHEGSAVALAVAALAPALVGVIALWGDPQLASGAAAGRRIVTLGTGSKAEELVEALLRAFAD